MTESIFLLKLVYGANIIVAGWIGITSLFFPKTAMVSIFSNAYQPTELVRLLGALWLAIALLSIAGLFRPLAYSPVLVLQLIYKGAWLLAVAVPAMIQQQRYPKEMAVFFLVWVLVLPFVIPWKNLV